MKKGLVTVVIPNYNYGAFLREAIDSVLAQTYDNIEVVVVDDGSSDVSRTVIESYSGRIRPIFQQNKGVSAARNAGAAIGSGEFLAFLDADDVWLPDKVEKQMKVFEGNEKIGLVHVGFVEIDLKGERGKTFIEGKAGRVAEDMLKFEGPVILAGGSGFVLRKSIFDAVGGFDERLSTSADWDIAFQSAYRCEVGFVPEPLLKYRMHGSNMHSNIAVMERDTEIAWAKAFETLGDEVGTSGRRYYYARLYRVLAGSYFQNRQYAGFARNFVKSIFLSPSLLADYIKLVFKRARS